MELTPEVIKRRLDIERLLRREEGALSAKGLLPTGEGVSIFVDPDGSTDIKRIQRLCGGGAAERVEDFLRPNIPNSPWSRRTKEAQLRAVCNNGVPSGRNRSIRRGPGRYSLDKNEFTHR